MGLILILICFAGSGALTVFLVELCRDDWKRRKSHVTRIEDLLGSTARPLHDTVPAIGALDREPTGIGTGSSSAAG